LVPFVPIDLVEIIAGAVVERVGVLIGVKSGDHSVRREKAGLLPENLQSLAKDDWDKWSTKPIGAMHLRVDVTAAAAHVVMLLAEPNQVRQIVGAASCSRYTVVGMLARSTAAGNHADWIVLQAGASKPFPTLCAVKGVSHRS
jgi:hypothetical protein